MGLWWIDVGSRSCGVGSLDLGGLLVLCILFLIPCSDSVHYFGDLSSRDDLSLHNVLW